MNGLGKKFEGMRRSNNLRPRLILEASPLAGMKTTLNFFHPNVSIIGWTSKSYP